MGRSGNPAKRAKQARGEIDLGALAKEAKRRLATMKPGQTLAMSVQVTEATKLTIDSSNAEEMTELLGTLKAIAQNVEARNPTNEDTALSTINAAFQDFYGLVNVSAGWASCRTAVEEWITRFSDLTTHWTNNPDDYVYESGEPDFG